MALGKPTSRRRERVKAHAQAARVGDLSHLLSRRQMIGAAVASGLAIALFATVLAGWVRHLPDPGTTLSEPVVARVDFDLVDRSATESARRRAMETAPVVLAYRESQLIAWRRALDELATAAVTWDRQRQEAARQARTQRAGSTPGSPANPTDTPAATSSADGENAGTEASGTTGQADTEPGDEVNGSAASGGAESDALDSSSPGQTGQPAGEASSAERPTAPEPATSGQSGEADARVSDGDSAPESDGTPAPVDEADPPSRGSNGVEAPAGAGSLEDDAPAEVTLPPTLQRLDVSVEQATALASLAGGEDGMLSPAWNDRRSEFIGRLMAVPIMSTSWREHAVSLPQGSSAAPANAPPSPDEANGLAEGQRPLVFPVMVEVVQPGGLTAGESAAVPTSLLMATADVLTLEDVEALDRRVAHASEIWPPSLRGLMQGLTRSHLGPTHTVDSERTASRREAAAAAVPPVRDRFEAGQVLLAAGRQVTSEDLALIVAEQSAFESSVGFWTGITRWLGRLTVMASLAAALWVYLLAFYPRVATNPLRAASMTALVLAALGLSMLLKPLNESLDALSLTLPTLIAVMVLSTAYDRRLALGVGVILTALVTLAMGLEMWLLLTLAAGVSTSSAVLKEVRTRSTLIGVGLIAGLAMAAMALAAGAMLRPLHLDGQWLMVLRDALAAAGSGLVAGMVVQAALPGMERLFGVVTAMKLKELNDASHPLLRRMAQEASGTYQHSLRIADMAEAAAEAIDADGLLCRVGAMYHDVGKVNKPEYFVENQGGGPNQHDKLSPAMSQLIIVGHVKDGVEMAREYNLPPSIRHLIESHHGTTLVAYFYHAARKQTEQQGREAPSEFEFRYPGPKPQTREAAIMMVCDGVEAAARSLSEPTPVRLEQLVQKIAGRLLEDGQFDECNLTLRELHRIEEAVTRTVRAVYHSRIKYPGQEKKPQRSAAGAAG